jgi:hypothetical protein
MANITNLTVKVEEDINAVMDIVMGKIDKKAISEMNAEEFMLMKTIFNLVDSTTQLMKEYGTTLVEIDKKLNILIEGRDQ